MKKTDDHSSGDTQNKWKEVDKWNIACHSSKQRMSQSSAIAALLRELVSPEGTQEGKNTCHLAAIRLQPLPMVTPEETLDMKTQDTGPRQLSAYQRNDFSEPRPLHSSHIRKALNSLTCTFWFSLINNHLWCSDYLPFVAKFLYVLAPPSPPARSSSLRVTWDAASRAWSPKNSHRKKHNPQLLGCEYFVSQQSVMSWKGGQSRKRQHS